MIEMGGGVNVFGDLERESITIDEDLIFTKQPEVICGLLVRRRKAGGSGEDQGRRGWGLLPAIRNDRVYVVEEAPFGRPGPRLVEGLEGSPG